MFYLLFMLNTLQCYNECVVFQVLQKHTKMSIHWTLIAGFLYAEIAAVLLLVSPIISAKRYELVSVKCVTK